MRYLVTDLTQMMNFFGFQTFVDFVPRVGFLFVFLADDDGTWNGHPALGHGHCLVLVAARFLPSPKQQQQQQLNFLIQTNNKKTGEIKGKNCGIFI